MEYSSTSSLAIEPSVYSGPNAYSVFIVYLVDWRSPKMQPIPQPNTGQLRSTETEAMEVLGQDFVKVYC